MGTVVILIFVPTLTLILLLINPILSFTPLTKFKKDKQKLSAYECGFSTIPGQTRNPLTIAFYIVSILYLVFDLEIALMIPIVTGLELVGSQGFVIVLIFIVLLTGGFVFELSTGAINWSKIKE